MLYWNCVKLLEVFDIIFFSFFDTNIFVGFLYRLH